MKCKGGKCTSRTSLWSSLRLQGLKFCHIERKSKSLSTCTSAPMEIWNRCMHWKVEAHVIGKDQLRVLRKHYNKDLSNQLDRWKKILQLKTLGMIIYTSMGKWQSCYHQLNVFLLSFSTITHQRPKATIQDILYLCIVRRYQTYM